MVRVFFSNIQTISFILSDQIIDALKSDYEDMQSSIIYGESLSYDILISRITELNKRFHQNEFKLWCQNI